MDHRRERRVTFFVQRKAPHQRYRRELEQHGPPGIERRESEAGPRNLLRGARFEPSGFEQGKGETDGERQGEFRRHAPDGEIEARTALATGRGILVDDIGLHRRRQGEVGAKSEADALKKTTQIIFEAMHTKADVTAVKNSLGEVRDEALTVNAA